jgi:hypothetical protein
MHIVGSWRWGELQNLSARILANHRREYLQKGLNDKEEIERIRLATRSGRPVGREDFVRRLEAAVGMSLR